MNFLEIFLKISIFKVEIGKNKLGILGVKAQQILCQLDKWLWSHEKK
jgi:hypothetical protein